MQASQTCFNPKPVPAQDKFARARRRKGPREPDMTLPSVFLENSRKVDRAGKDCMYYPTAGLSAGKIGHFVSSYCFDKEEGGVSEASGELLQAYR